MFTNEKEELFICTERVRQREKKQDDLASSSSAVLTKIKKERRPRTFLLSSNCALAREND